MGRHQPYLKEPDSKVYTMGDREFVRITTLIDMLSKPALVPWAAKEERAGILEVLEQQGYRDPQSLLARLGERNGTFKNGQPKYCHQRKSGDAVETGGDAHDVLQNALAARQGWPSRWNVDGAGEQARKAAASGLRFCEENFAEPEALEEMVWSLIEGIAGTADFRGKIRPGGTTIKAILDWKTSAAIYDDMALQVAFYRKARIEMCPDDVDLWGGIVRLPKDGGKAEVRMWTPKELDACEPVIRGLRDAWVWREGLKVKR